MKTKLSVPAYISIASIFLFSCNFPYQPKQFVLPEIPSFFIAADSITSFTNSANVKIAYTLNEGSRFVYYIDFRQPSPAPVRLKKPVGKETVNGDSPLISPDGRFVTYYLTHGADLQGAYLQKLDPSSEPVLIAANGTEPHWWKDSSGQLYVLYSNQLMSTTMVKGDYATYRQKVSLDGNGALVGSSEQIAPYAMNGGMSANGRYLCTGYKNAAMYDLSDSLLISLNTGIQTCNPSIDPDTTHPNYMMFLNIGGAQNLNNPFLGNSDFPSPQIGQHAMIFIVDSKNTVIDYIPLTLLASNYGSYDEWQDPEWSNNSRFAMALGVLNESDADAVIIKNIGNGAVAKKVLRITPGKLKLNVTSTPYIWIGN